MTILQTKVKGLYDKGMSLSFISSELKIAQPNVERILRTIKRRKGI